MPVAEVLGVGEVRTHHTAADSTSLSSTLETADKLDIGLLLTGNDLSSPAFFSTGSACADLKRAGNFPLCSDKLACVVVTARTCRVDHCSDGGQFSAAREFPVRVSPRHRTDRRTRRHLTAVIRTDVTAGCLDRTPAYRCDAVHGT